MPAQITDQFYTLLKTTEDVSRAEESIDSLLASLYKVDTQTISDKIEQHLSRSLSRLLENHLKESSISPSDVEKTKTVLTDLKSSLERISIVSLTIAYDPPQKTVDTLAERVKQMYGNSSVLEIVIRPSIIGGAVITHNGVYMDLSLKKKLNTLFTTKQQEILSFLNSL